MAVGRCDLGADDFVGLGVVLASLAVTDDDVRAAELGQEGTGHLTGVRTRVVLREILGSELQPQPVTGR